jgi:hypothetical protein
MVVVSGAASRQVNDHPWSYTSPGQANTNCSGTADVNGTATSTGYGTTNVNGTVNSNTSCNTTYTPPQTTNGNWVTVENASWVTDVATGDQYLIQCTAHWRGSKCSYLAGGSYEADLEGNSIWITGRKGMKSETAKYNVLQYVQGTRGSPSPVNRAMVAGVRSGQPWTPDETYAWQDYQALSPVDKQTVHEFCSANPDSTALVPKDAPIHALKCVAWLSASKKAE